MATKARKIQFITTMTRKKELNIVVISAIANSGVPNVMDRIKESAIPAMIKNENLNTFDIRCGICLGILNSFLNYKVLKIGSRLFLYAMSLTASK